MSGPIFFNNSARCMKVCAPVPTMIRTCSCPRPPRVKLAKTLGRICAVGQGRVISSTTIDALWAFLARSSRGGVPVGEWRICSHLRWSIGSPSFIAATDTCHPSGKLSSFSTSPYQASQGTFTFVSHTSRSRPAQPGQQHRERLGDIEPPPCSRPRTRNMDSLIRRYFNDMYGAISWMCCNDWRTQSSASPTSPPGAPSSRLTTISS